MKQSFLLLALLFIVNAVMGNDRYVSTMQKQIKALYAASTPEEYQQAVNAFERIATAEKDKWEPLYYMAFGTIMIANAEKDLARKDQLLDRAMEAVTNAKAIAPNESELYALEGFVLMMKVTVDVQTRGMTLSPKAMQSYEKALKLNRENPRAMALMAQMQFGTARFFNSPPTEACELNAKAEQSMKVYKSDNPLAPVWGASMIESLKENCK